ncbi:MAG: biotin--[acetyl-CoA-carboxylase] ligase [Cetobacterium sp.]|uniref:biotin--[acetyl-CoA-carboxylase] ligase n=1 Tax=Cetobacterium sp. ZWU0022 TaxID=1340502 RepID=UPI0006477940|nr:biotin--[acetyl-CoA-carboxylase] ligase [Cetobacterium sp. ZWU0022]
MSTKELIISILEENKGQYLSGEAIGKKLHISRAAVSKAIKELKNNGYTILSVNKKGHCIPTKSNTLSAIEIKKNLKYDNEIIIKNSIDSTNTDGKRFLIENPTHGTTIIANEQTNGRGRKGRYFFSPKDTGIYMSILLKPELLALENPLKITIATAVAITKSIDELCQKNTLIKWVNDIYIEDKKIAGILTEATTDFESGSIENIIIGIGINFNTTTFPEELSTIAGSIFSEEEYFVNRNELIAQILNEIMDITNDLNNENIIKKYREKSFLIGRDIVFFEKEIENSGKVIDIDDNGYLIVDTISGSKKTLYAGEVSIKW